MKVKIIINEIVDQLNLTISLQKGKVMKESFDNSQTLPPAPVF